MLVVIVTMLRVIVTMLRVIMIVYVHNNEKQSGISIDLDRRMDVSKNSFNDCLQQIKANVNPHLNRSCTGLI